VAPYADANVLGANGIVVAVDPLGEEELGYADAMIDLVNGWEY